MNILKKWFTKQSKETPQESVEDHMVVNNPQMYIMFGLSEDGEFFVASDVKPIYKDEAATIIAMMATGDTLPDLMESLELSCGKEDAELIIREAVYIVQDLNDKKSRLLQQQPLVDPTQVFRQGDKNAQ